MMRIALVQPPSSYLEQTNCLPTFQVGVGLLSIKDFLRRAGHDVIAVHLPWARLHGMSYGDAISHVARFDPDLVALGLNWLHFSDGALETGRLIRRALPRAHVVVGGQHASLFSCELAQRHGDCFHAVLQGEAELTMQSIARSIAEHGRIASDIPGVILAGDEAEPAGSAPQVIGDLDTLPFYHGDDVWPGYPSEFPGFPAEVAPLLGNFRRRAAVSTTRGPCPRGCSYCIAAQIGAIQGRQRLAAHSPAWLAEHIAFLLQRGMNSITIQDPLFVLGDKPLIELADELHRRGLSKRLRVFDLFVEPGAYSRQALDAVSSVAEMVVVEFGVETGSPKVAHAMGREADYGKVLRNLTDARDAGVIPVSWWMVGLPEEGPAEVEETKRFVAETMKEGIIPAQVSPMVLFPQTRLARQSNGARFTPLLRSFEDFSRFSRQPLDASGDYPDLITHRSERQGVDDTLRFNREIKQLFAEHWPALEARYRRSAVSFFLTYQKKILTYRYY